MCFTGCVTQKTVHNTVPPPFPVLEGPTSPPPNFTPTFPLSLMQVNRLPHPFNVNGSVPYAVWVDGKRLNLNPQQTKELTSFLNLKFEQPPNTAAIHAGEGWLFPIPKKELTNE